MVRVVRDARRVALSNWRLRMVEHSLREVRRRHANAEWVSPLVSARSPRTTPLRGHPGGFRTTDEGGATRYDGKTFEHFTRARGLNSGNVYCMLEDRDGNIWFGSVDAVLCRYDGKTFMDFSATVPVGK